MLPRIWFSVLAFFFFLYFTGFLFANHSPASPHYVGKGDFFSPAIVALEYAAFLNTKATQDYAWHYFAKHFDSSFMIDKSSKQDVDSCIIRKMENGKFAYFTIPGRENYTILQLNNKEVLEAFKQWRHNPTAKEMRDYINNKIAETVSHDSKYADAAYKIRESYSRSSSYSFDALDEVTKGLLGDHLAKLPLTIAFDKNSGRATSCLFDQEAEESLLYFDATVSSAEGESVNDFIDFPAQMQVCAHLYLGATYYRPEGVFQTLISPDPAPVSPIPASCTSTSSESSPDNQSLEPDTN